MIVSVCVYMVHADHSEHLETRGWLQEAGSLPPPCCLVIRFAVQESPRKLTGFYNLCITLYVCFACIYAYMPHECLVSKEVRTRVE